jgi:aspartate kinase
LEDHDLKNIIVIKFGGTSLMTTERIKNAAQIAANEAAAGKRIVVVVSAMGHTTDHLIGLSEGITSVPSRRELDALMATGEQVSASLMTIALQSIGCKARSFSGAQARITTDRQFGNAKIEQINTRVLATCLDEGYIPVVTGFQGTTISGEMTTLGRGGSDTTAIALAAALKAERCDIYTDVDGIFSADPRLIKDAVRLDELSVSEMLELARNGAQVLNARSVELARDRHVAVRVRSTFKPRDTGTLVTSTCASGRNFSGVSLNKNVDCIEFQLERLEMGRNRSLRSLRQARTQTKLDLLRMLAAAGIEAETVSAYRPNPFKIYFKVHKADTVTAIATLHKAALPIRNITVNANLVGIVLVATEITTRHDVESLAVMLQHKIMVHAISHSHHVLGLYVSAEFAEEGLKAIHACFSANTSSYSVGNTTDLKVIAS